jgi:hypothetical protein
MGEARLMPLPKITQCSKYFGADACNDLSDYTIKYLESLRMQLRTVRTSKATDMRRILEGRPRESTKSFPWDNAANLVVQLVASFTDQLAARMVMGIWNTDPIFPVKVQGSIPAKLKPERKRELLEDFLQSQSSNPATLNLIETEYTWFRNAIAYGCQAMKVNYVDDVNWVVKGGEARRVKGYSGPELMPIDFEDWLMPVLPMPVARMPFKAQAIHLTQFDIMERVATGAWSKKEAERILSAHTTTMEDQTRKTTESDQKINPSDSPESFIFTCYECHVKYLQAGKIFDCILTVHPETKSVPKAIFNFYPDGIQPYQIIRFGGHGKRAYGLGLVEALQDYQEEVSQIHNQRRDAGTAANTNALRVTPGSQLDTMTTLYPMGIIPAAPGTIEVLNLGRNPIETIQDEELVRKEAAERAGVAPSFSGSGSGGPNKKGVYSAMGTMSVMQEGNSRTDMNLALFRNAHVVLGQTMMGLYAHFGADKEILKGYGDDKKLLDEALEGIAAGTFRAHVNAGTASVNREVEKQNLMLMMQNLRQHYQQTIGMLQMMLNPMTPPDLRKYLAEAVQSTNMIMRWTVRNFGIHAGGQNTVPETEELTDKAIESVSQPPPGQKALPPGQPQPPQPGQPPQQQPGPPPQGPGGPPVQ